MGEPVNVAELSSSDFKEFLNSFDHVFSDCDGVIWLGNPLPGSGEFFKNMKQYGKTVHYVSNASFRTKQIFEEKFKAAGIENGYENLTIPCIAIAEYLKSINFSKKVYCIASNEAVRVLQSNGFTCVEGPLVSPDNYHEYLQFLEDDLDVGAVVIDIDFKLNLAKQCKATAYLWRPDVIFIIGANDVNVPLKPGCIMSIGPGTFIDLVIKDTKRVPIQLGKPGKALGELVMRRAGVTDPSRVLFIGDAIDQDVGVGKNTGFKTLFLLSTTTKEEMLAHKTIKPDYYAESLASILPLL